MLGDVTRARSTGTLVELVDNRDGYFSEDAPWHLVCHGTDADDSHGGVLDCATKSEAIEWRSHPDEWCPTCQEDAHPGIHSEP